jgi:hypothetical protein
MMERVVVVVVVAVGIVVALVGVERKGRIRIYEQSYPRDVVVPLGEESRRSQSESIIDQRAAFGSHCHRC